MKNIPIVILVVLMASAALMPQLNRYALGQPFTQAAVDPAPIPLSSALEFKQTAIEVKVVNATYADVMMVSEIANPSNQTLKYSVSINPPQRYIYYPLGIDEATPPPRMEIKVVSEAIGELDVTFDRWGNARATGSIEANGEDVIHVEGWTGLGASSRMIWRESIEGNLGFSIRPETGYEGLVSPERTEVEVKFSYPVEYTKTDEANYRVDYTDGFKVIEYWEEFYGSVGLTLDLYKPRTPVNSLAIFSALWVVLIAFVVWTRRKKAP